MNPRLLTPSISLLIAFEASARNLSFTRAAKEISLTQSAVSRQVQTLEELLGVNLFRRFNRQIALTEAGGMYQREVEAALQRIRNATLQVIAHRTGGDSIHLAALPTFATKWLLPRLNSFYEKHPGIFIHVHSRIGQFDLGLAGIDAVIGVGDGSWNGLSAYHLCDEQLLPVIKPNLPCEAQVQCPADIARHLLLQVASRPDSWHRWFAVNGVPLDRMRSGPQFELTSHLIQAVASGLGVGLIPSFLIREELQSGVLKLALNLPLVSGAAYYLFVPSEKKELPSICAFKDWLLQQKMIDAIDS